MTFRRLMEFELQALRAQRLIVAVLAGLALACAYAVTYGGNVNHSQLIIIDSLQRARAGTVDSLRRDLGRGMQISSDTGFEGRSGLTNLDDYVAVIAAKAPHPLQALAIGQADVLPYQRVISARSLYYDGGTIRLRGAQPEIRNPEKQLAGNFDLAFVVVYLVPLVLIALCYNVLSDDAEFGTLALVRSSPVPVATLVLWRVAVRTGVVCLIVGSAAAVALLTVSRGSGLDGVWWLLVVLAYSVFWGAMSTGISARRGAGGTSAMILLGAWLACIVVIPAIVSAVVDARNPVTSRADLLSVAREKVGTLWDAPRTTTFGPFWAANPDLRRDTVVRRPAYTEQFAVWHFNLTRLLAPVAAPYDQLVARRQHDGRRFGVISPALVTASALAALARSDLRSNLAFEDTVLAFQGRRARLADSLTFSAARFSSQQFQSLEPWPLATDYGVGHARAYAAMAIALLLAAGLLIALAARHSLRRHLT